jgi:hypothetical protein
VPWSEGDKAGLAVGVELLVGLGLLCGGLDSEVSVGAKGL